eukprot:TRINITY_DN4546_c0_g1_i1.p1 TRINITY_DN4546_c0_g1~~TRINITY_DN4546_c0_g1_i1.p1  ORF type:complete len:323 (-),score=30.26 TRINITY_DN4546_c0_g1_i1:112-1080(-)
MVDYFVEEEFIEESENATVHLIAGAVAGVTEHCGMFPLDTIKTFQQAGKSGGVLGTFKYIYGRRGIRGLFRGMKVVILTAAPVHGISFTIYEFFKRISGANQPGHHAAASAFSGVCATLAHDACIVPVDTIKQRLQFSGKPYRGIIDCMMKILKKHGMGGLYRGYTTTTTMNIPYAVFYYAVYESAKQFLGGSIFSTQNASGDFRHNVMLHLLAGASAGGVAACITNPLDVSKTRLQLGDDVGPGKHYRGMINTMRDIWRSEGWLGYTKGIIPRTMFHATSGAIVWATYEYMKFMLRPLDQSQPSQNQTSSANDPPNQNEHT